MTDWINCSDQMPTDDNDLMIIVSFDSTYEKLRWATGAYLNRDQLRWRGVTQSVENAEWTPYTKELWEELNK